MSVGDVRLDIVRLAGGGRHPYNAARFSGAPGARASGVWRGVRPPLRAGIARNRYQVMPDRFGRDAAWSDDDTAEAEPWQPLTAAEARVLRARLRTPPLWYVPAGQAVAGVAVAALAWLISGRVGVMLSALYGAAVVVVPAAVMVLGLARSPSRAVPAALAVRWAVWEALKLLLAVGMLALAPRVVVPLSWPALLLALVV
jgi:ATP synthase protein I